MSVREATAPRMSEEEFVRLWMMGIGSKRSIGRPRDFDGAQSNAEDFFAKFTNWLAGMPGDVEVMLKDVKKCINEITREHMDARQWVMANGIKQVLRPMCGGKALSIVRNVEERGNGFEAWRRLMKEYRPRVAVHKVGLLEQIMEDKRKMVKSLSRGSIAG